MSRGIDVRNEMRRLAGSKAVHAAAGAGALASQTLRDLPSRLARWRGEATQVSLSARAGEYMSTVRARAVTGYDRLADRGQRVLSAKRAAGGTGPRGKSGA